MSRATKADQIVGENLRKVRRFRGLNQQRIAERMAMMHPTWTRQTVGDIERGLRAVTVGELVDLASILDATVTLLLSEELDALAVL